MGDTVVAVDLGYGHVKLKTAKKELAFPSFVTPVVGSADHGTYDVVTVAVGDRRFTAGRDSELTMTAHIERHRDSGYATTDAYRALMKTALWYVGELEIDLLVVGLPMSTFAANQRLLIQSLEGDHLVPDFSLGERGTGKRNTSVRVKKVLVLPQAVGALFSAADEFPTVRTSRALVFDLGFYTLDVLCASNMRPLSDRKGAVHGGMSGYIEALHSSLAAEVSAVSPQAGRTFAMPSYLYEVALKQPDKPLSVSCGSFDLKPHIENARSRLLQYLDQASALTRGYSDMQVAVLAGGGAHLLEPVIRQRFPDLINIVVPEHPQQSIANGYFICGEDMLNRLPAHAA